MKFAYQEMEWLVHSSFYAMMHPERAKYFLIKQSYTYLFWGVERQIYFNSSIFIIESLNISWDEILKEVLVSSRLKVIGNLQSDLPLPLGHLVPPEPVPVEAGEAVDHDGDGQGQDEQTRQGAKTADKTTKESLKQLTL